MMAGTDAEVEMGNVPGIVPEEDQFVYAAANVFSVISPYIFHTHASRVFSEVSACLRRAQEASADVIARLRVSERSQAQERQLRKVEADRHLSRLKELQTLLQARVEKEANNSSKRKFLKRRLGEECSRSEQLQARLTEAEDELRCAREGFDAEKVAIDERWSSVFDQGVKAAKEAGKAEANTKVEAAMIRRVRSLSSHVARLKEKVKALEIENARLQETLLSRPSDPGRAASRSEGSPCASKETSSRSRESSSEAPSEGVSSRPSPSCRCDGLTATAADGSPGASVASLAASSPTAAARSPDGGSDAGPALGFAEMISGFSERMLGLTGRSVGLPPRASWFREGREAPHSGPTESTGVAAGAGKKVAVETVAAPPRQCTPDDRPSGLSSQSRSRGPTARATEPWDASDRGVQLHEGSADVLANSRGGTRRRGLGGFPRRSGAFRSVRTAAFDGDSQDVLADNSSPSRGAFVNSGNTGRRHSADARAATSVDSTATPVVLSPEDSCCRGGSERWQHSLGSESTPLSLEALLASGEFYPAASGREAQDRRAAPWFPSTTTRWKSMGFGDRRGVSLAHAASNKGQGGDVGRGWDTSEPAGPEKVSAAKRPGGSDPRWNGGLITAAAVSAPAPSSAPLVDGNDDESDSRRRPASDDALLWGLGGGDANSADVATDPLAEASEEIGGGAGGGAADSRAKGTGAGLVPSAPTSAALLRSRSAPEGSPLVYATSSGCSAAGAEKSLDDLLREMAVVPRGTGGDRAGRGGVGGGARRFERGRKSDVDEGKPIRDGAGVAARSVGGVASSFNRGGRTRCV